MKKQTESNIESVKKDAAADQLQHASRVEADTKEQLQHTKQLEKDLTDKLGSNKKLQKNLIDACKQVENLKHQMLPLHGIYSYIHYLIVCPT